MLPVRTVLGSSKRSCSSDFRMVKQEQRGRSIQGYPSHQGLQSDTVDPGALVTTPPFTPLPAVQVLTGYQDQDYPSIVDIKSTELT